MKRLIALLWLIIAVPALAGPQMTVLLPTETAMSPQSMDDAFRGYASARAAFPDTPIALVANSLYTSDVALVVLDATQGPLPNNREHTLAARQAGVPNVAVLITNVDALYDLVGEQDGDEFLALEEQEIRTVLELYGVGGPDTRVYHDSSHAQRATSSMSGDLEQLAADLSALPAEQRQNEKMKTASAAKGEIYLLTDGEANGQAVTIEGTRSLTLWVGGQTTTAEVSVNGVGQPGDAISFGYRTEVPTPAAAAARMMLIDNDQIVGIGVIAAVTAR